MGKGDEKKRSGLVGRVHNAQISATFEQLADLLEIDGANPFRVRAYRRAAQQVSGLQREAADMHAEGFNFATLPGIGEDLASKIEELLKTGKLQQLNEISARIPAGLAQLVKLPGIGPKRAKTLHERLKIHDIDSLRTAIAVGAVARLQGFGKTLISRISSGLVNAKQNRPRFKLNDAEEFAEPLRSFIASIPGVDRAIIAGSYRRRQETVGDIDILVTAKPGQASGLFTRVLRYPDIATIVARGTTKASVVLGNGLQVDLRVVGMDSFGAALLYFTGSKDHNIAIRLLGQKAGLKINEYGVFRNGRKIAGLEEDGIYSLFGMDLIPPELRENRGELAAAQQHSLPHLVTQNDMRGDLHVHTQASDGIHSIAQMAQAALQRGYGYLAISDHSRRMTIAHGLDEDRLLAQIDEIDALQSRFKTLRLLKSCEVEILADGSLDLGNAALRRLDFVCGAVHSSFGLPREKQTARIIRALDNPLLTILAHPTGRLINERPAYEVDLERVIRAAADRGCILEINSQPSRLDLSDINCRMARDMGAKLAICSDAHSAQELALMRFGVDQARRGWLRKEDVVNTLAWPQLKAQFRH